MSVNYSLAYMSSEPGNPDAPKKYYAKARPAAKSPWTKWPRTSHTPPP